MACLLSYYNGCIDGVSLLAPILEGKCYLNLAYLKIDLLDLISILRQATASLSIPIVDDHPMSGQRVILILPIIDSWFFPSSHHTEPLRQATTSLNIPIVDDRPTSYFNYYLWAIVDSCGLPSFVLKLMYRFFSGSFFD